MIAARPFWWLVKRAEEQQGLLSNAWQAVPGRQRVVHVLIIAQFRQRLRPDATRAGLAALAESSADKDNNNVDTHEMIVETLAMLLPEQSRARQFVPPEIAALQTLVF
jgi:hypothetical protein